MNRTSARSGAINLRYFANICLAVQVFLDKVGRDALEKISANEAFRKLGLIAISQSQSILPHGGIINKPLQQGQFAGLVRALRKKKNFFLKLSIIVWSLILVPARTSQFENFASIRFGQFSPVKIPANSSAIRETGHRPSGPQARGALGLDEGMWIIGLTAEANSAIFVDGPDESASYHNGTKFASFGRYKGNLVAASGAVVHHFISSCKNLHQYLREASLHQDDNNTRNTQLREVAQWTCLNVTHDSYTLTEKILLRRYVLNALPAVDLVYFHGIGNFDSQLKELYVFWKLLKPGGIIAVFYPSHNIEGISCNGDNPRNELSGKDSLTSTRSAGEGQTQVVEAFDSWVTRYSELMVSSLENCTFHFSSTHLFDESAALALKALSTPRLSRCIIKNFDDSGTGIIVGEKVVKHEKTSRPALERCKEKSSLLSLIILYYEDNILLKNLIDQYRRNWGRELKDAISIVVVDDGSRHQPLRNFTDLFDSFKVCISSIVEDKRWNIGGARNLAAFIAPTEYLLFTDADTILSNSAIKHALNMSIVNDSSVYVNFPRKSKDEVAPDPAVMLIRRDIYWINGGCDEDFVGHYGYTDPHFKYNLARKNIPQKSVFEYIKADPSLSIQGKSKRAERKLIYNQQLFEFKKEGAVPWSNDCLRFHWNIH